jgi:hypothetical protein
VLCTRAPALRSQVPNSVPATVRLLLPELPAFPGDADRTTATLYDSAADRAPDTCSPTLKLAATARSAEPETLHKTEDSATQRELSQDVCPALKPALYLALPNPRPVAVTRLPPVDAAFVSRTELKLGAAKLTTELKLPACPITDATTYKGLPTPRDTRHAMTLSAPHTDLIEEDPPIRPVALTPYTPIASPKRSTDEAPDTATCSKLTVETLAAS